MNSGLALSLVLYYLLVVKLWVLFVADADKKQDFNVCNLTHSCVAKYLSRSLLIKEYLLHSSFSACT